MEVTAIEAGGIEGWNTEALKSFIRRSDLSRDRANRLRLEGAIPGWEDKCWT